MPRPRCSSITVFFVLTAFCPFLYAQSHSWLIDGPAFSASPVEIQGVATHIKAEPFADVTVLFQQEHYRLDSLGKITRVHDLLYRIETKAGVDEWSQTSVGLALFDNHLDEDSIKAGQQANLLRKNASFADLHTLSCLYAAQGKTTEARQLLLDAMAAGNQAEPNSAVWFGFGSIYEQLGLNDAAIAAYHKVDVPDGTVSPLDTYNLAQDHLKASTQTDDAISDQKCPY